MFVRVDVPSSVRVADQDLKRRESVCVEDQRPRMERFWGVRVWVLDGFIGAPCVGFPFFIFVFFILFLCLSCSFHTENMLSAEEAGRGTFANFLQVEGLCVNCVCGI